MLFKITSLSNSVFIVQLLMSRNYSANDAKK